MISGQVKIGAGCRVGPFAHLRDGTVLDDGVEVGAFVEVNRSHLDSGTIARHLAYLGNAEVGATSTSARGAITANFDGSRKNETEIGDRAASARRRDGRPQSRSARTPSSGPGR